MKKIIKFSLSAMAMAAVMMFSSCEEENLKPDDPNEGNQGNTEFPEALDHSDVEIPIVWTPYNVESSGIGVSIEVTSVEDTDFSFVCRPGSSVKSYKLCAYPLSQIYNILLEDQSVMQATPGEARAVAVEEALRLYLDERDTGNTQEGATGLLGGSDIYYSEEINGDDFSELSFKWSETEYTRAAPIVPDAEYLLLVLSYFEDKAAGEQGDLSICYLRTSSQPLVGTPGLQIQIIPYYAGFEARYIRNNESAAGFYEYIGVKSEVEEYIEMFGRRMYRDYLRTWRQGEAYTFDSVNSSIQVRITPEDQVLVAAVAVDINGTPTADFEQADSRLLEIPENMKYGQTEISIDRTGSMIVWLTAKMDEYTRDANIRIVDASEADKFREGGSATPAEIEALAASLVDEGWRIQNPNFEFNPDTEEPLGEGAEVQEVQIDMKSYLPGHEYAVVYVTRNYYNMYDQSQVYVSDKFRMKDRNIENPELYNEELKVELTEPTTIGFTIKFTYDPEKIASYYWQIVSPTENGQANMMSDNKPQIPGFVGPNEKLDQSQFTHEKWMTYFFEAIDLFNNPLCNIWFYNPFDESVIDNADGTITDQWTFSDMVAGTTYEVAYAAEDWNGNVSETKLLEIMTTKMNPGPDPQADILCQPSTDASNPGFTGDITIGKDVGRLLVMQVNSEAELGFDPMLIINGDSRYYYSQYIDMMRDRVIGGGEDGQAGGIAYYSDVDLSYSGEGPYFVLCVPVGADRNGEVFGDLIYAIYYEGKIHYDIADFGIPKN